MAVANSGEMVVRSRGCASAKFDAKRAKVWTTGWGPRVAVSDVNESHNAGCSWGCQPATAASSANSRGEKARSLLAGNCCVGSDLGSHNRRVVEGLAHKHNCRSNK